MPLPPNITGSPLTPQDLATLAERWITPEIAAAAMIRRVDTLRGSEIVGANGKSDYAGMIFPYTWPGENYIRDWRLRRDHPDLEQSIDGKVKPIRKYMAPPGRGNRLYIPHGVDPDWLSDANVPIILTEGEMKTLALWRLSAATFLPVGLSGVWNFRGTIAKSTDSSGKRQDVKGVIPDLMRINWDSRTVTIIFDSDIATNFSVFDARRQLTRELEDRGANVHHFKFPDTSLKGIDDFLAARGSEATLTLISKAKRVTKIRKSTAPIPAAQNLIIGDKGPLAIVANAITLLRQDPAWEGVFVYNEFAERIQFSAAPPWGPEPGSWRDHHEVLVADWMQHNSVRIAPSVARQAVDVVARDHRVHPPREYLDSLDWDGIPRLHTWLQIYLGVDDEHNPLYVREVGSKWLISAVARIMQPGCKVDCCLILEGAQGTFKSTAIRTLGGDWFTDEISDIGGKDSKMEIAGVWIIEIGELASLGRAATEMVKNFMSCGTDHFRPSYGHAVVDRPRQCVFAGTHNPNGSGYLKDETGARRFWPVECGHIDIPSLARDRDQLWAEAAALYRQGSTWWLGSAVTPFAQAEQRDRTMPDAWDNSIQKYLDSVPDTSVDDIFSNCLRIEIGKRSRPDMLRIVSCLASLGWHKERLPRNETGVRPWKWLPPAGHRVVL